uniref:Maestro heat-like repeat family member 2A n=1 Tax=Nannospalax galili TaxID=1026970 RepID=A0A8C6W7M8_NANGA
MAEAVTDSNEDVLGETEDFEPLESEDDGTFQQVTNLLNVMDSESAKTDTTGSGLDVRKTLASVIITEKATTHPSAVMNALIRCLKVPEISTQRKVNIYSILQIIELEERCVQRLVAIASKEMRDIPETEGFEKAEVDSNTLVALSQNHFSLGMYELQHHLKPLNLTNEFVIVTLAKLANGNVFEFVPYMGITLATIFMMLRLANEAKMRQVICSAMETFCEMVQLYLRHLEDSLYPVMTEDYFKLFPCQLWDVKLGVIKSLRPMLSLLLPNDDLREQVYDYIPLLLAEFQGASLLQVLRRILEVSVTTNTPIPPVLLHPIFTELYVQVRSTRAHQFSSQNLAEILQCFIAPARSYPKELMNSFSQVEMSREAVCLGTLSLIRAVVSADDPKMNMKTIYLAIRVVRNTLSDTRPKVRMAVLCIIGQLVQSGFQEKIKDWLTLSTYKLTNHRECFYQRDLEEKMVYKVTINTVKIITSSLSGMTNEFWVRLLCYIMETDYTEALTPICISLTNLAENQIHGKDTEAGMAGKSKHVDLPAPQKLLARLLVLMSSLCKGEGRGIAMLNLLRTLSQSIIEIPLLVQYLEDHTEFTWNQKTWEDKLIQFLRNSLKKTCGTSWSLRLSRELNNQVETFHSPSLEKGFLYRALGFTLGRSLQTYRVEVLLLELLYKTDYSKDFDREGVILCFGLCARSQVKAVLNVLQDFEEKIQESEQSWQIGTWRKDHPWRRETVKRMLLTHVDSPITTKIIHHYSSSCQVTVICLWAASGLPPCCAGQAIIKAEPGDHLVSPVWTMAMGALSQLSTLKPFYSSEESSELMDISIHAVISLQPPGEDNEPIKTLYANALSSLKQLMEGLMQRQLDPKGLQETVHVSYLAEEWEREKAMTLHLHLMQIYVQRIGVCLGQFGTLVGLIAPCTCDPHRTRLASTNVLSSLLDLHVSQICSLWGEPKERELEKCKEDRQGTDMEKIFTASSRIAKVVCPEFNCEEVVSLTQKLCENTGAMDLRHDKATVIWIGIFLQMRVTEIEDKVIQGAILVHLPVVDHPEVRRCLIEGILLLAHYHQETVLTSLLRQPLPMERWVPRGVDMNMPFARTMLHGLLGQLQSSFTPRKNATSKADIWRLAAVDPLMVNLCTIPLLMEKMGPDDRLQGLFPDLLYTFVLKLSSKATSPILKTWRLVPTGPLPQEMTLQRCARAGGRGVVSLQLLVRRINREPLAQALEEQSVWTLLENGGTFLEGVSLLARLCVQNVECYMQRLVELVLRGMGSEVLSCRVSSTAICVEFMSHRVLYQEKLLRPALVMLEKGVGQDKDEVLQVLSLHALGNMALGASRKVKQYRKLLLEKCLSPLHSQASSSVIAESMEALTKILAELREGDLASFEAISEQCGAFFDNESGLLRMKAFVLFWKLAKVVGISKKHFFKGEVKKVCIPLLQHCQDPFSSVAQECMVTMIQCVHFWGSRSLESLLGRSDDSTNDQMMVFQTNMCSILAQKKPAVLRSFLLETMTYVKSDLSWIRITACSLAVIIVKHMSAGVRRAALETLKVLDGCG